MGRDGRTLWLSGFDTLTIFMSPPPPGTKGKTVPALRFTAGLRDRLANGVGVNRAVWIEIYEWLGRPLPKPPREDDLARMADALVDAFESGRLVALEEKRARPLEARGGIDSPPVSEPAPATMRDEPPIAPAKTWIGLALVDQDGVPVPTRGFSLVLPDKSVREGFFDARGRFHLDGIDPGMCALTFTDLDVSDFKEPLPMKGGKSDGKGAVELPSGENVHVVATGDTLATVAERAGFLHSSTIWNHPKNEELRRRREHPFVLLEGDAVFMPEKTPHTTQVGTTRETKFVVYIERTVARERARTFRDDVELALDKATVRVDGDDDPDAKQAGDVLDAPVPRASHRLEVDVADARGSLAFALGALMPIREARGVLTRLANLGFVPAAAIGDDEESNVEDDERETLACELFQESLHAKPTGEVDDKTVAALMKRAGA